MERNQNLSEVALNDSENIQYENLYSLLEDLKQEVKKNQEQLGLSDANASQRQNNSSPRAESRDNDEAGNNVAANHVHSQSMQPKH